MLSTEITSHNIKFQFRIDETIVAFDQCCSTLAGDEFAAFLLLKELIENGKAQLTGNTISLPHEESASLDSLDARLLALPSRFPFDIRIDSSDTLNSTGFRFKWGFYEYAEGKQLFGKRTGSIVELEDGGRYLLSLDQLNLCNALDEFNSLPAQSKAFRGNLLRFAEIKNLSEKSTAVLDRYLASEKVLAPAKISLKVTKAVNEDVQFLPEIETDVQSQFEEKFKANPQVEDVYAVQDEAGDRTRIVLTDQQVGELRKMKQANRLPREEKVVVLQNPLTLFDPDAIDLDNYSDRVVEIGFYKPKFYPFVSPYKSIWIPGLVIETTPQERKKITIKDEDELAAGRMALEEVKKTNCSSVNWKDSSIPVSEFTKLLRLAERQFQSPKQPVTKDPSSGDKVLIIKENIAELDFGNQQIPSQPFKEVQFHDPPNLKGTAKLLNHQRDGVAWMQSLLMQNHSGSLLADDMGLGKTLQVLCLIQWYYQEAGTDINVRPSLVVAPVTLLENWEKEFDTFFESTDLRITKAYGSYGKEFLVSSLTVDNVRKELEKKHIVLTNYETLRSHQLKLCAVDWGVVVLDEAQKIKTPGTLVTNAAKALKAQFKVAVTGTPVENTWMDLWCIVDFIIPGLLGSAREFSGKYQKPLKLDETDIPQLGQQLRNEVGVFLMRRLKEDVLSQLPKKHLIPREETSRRMPQEQMDRYNLEISQAKDASSSTDRNRVLSAIWAVRNISDHPYLLEKQIDVYNSPELVRTSAKLQITHELLKQIKVKGEKVLLYADRKETQRLLAKVLRDEFGIHASIINGDTPAYKPNAKSSVESRQGTIDQFQAVDGFNAIVLSPLAAGVGLNITGANHVIHYSRHWNPAKEDQATDRVYRIGQEKDVYIYYPMAVAEGFESFDVVLDKLLERKRALSRASLYPVDQAEVDPEDLFKGVFGSEAGPTTDKKFSIDDIDKLDPFLFESLIGVLFSKRGFVVQVTPRSNDKGADVVALSETRNLLIQAKLVSGEVNQDAVGEILKARGYYHQKYNKDFTLLIVTNRTLSGSALGIASANSVTVNERNDLNQALISHPVILKELLEMERKRVRTV
ncbi:MAG: SNF2-related protein [bacterium]